MPDYLSPGVYIQELEGPAPITGVSTSIAAFIGMAERGPLNVPIPCTGPGDYQRWFGGLLRYDEFQDPVDPNRAHCYLPYAVAGFFGNAGQLAYVMRVLPEEATYAGDYLYDRGTPASISTTLMKTSAVGDGLGNSPQTGGLIVRQPVPAVGNSVRIGDGSVSEYGAITAAAPATGVVALDMPLRLSHAANANIASYAIGATTSFTLAADAEPGNTTLFLLGAGPLAAANTLIELTANGVAEIVIPTAVSSTAPSAWAVTLAQPLTQSFSWPGATVVSFASTPAVGPEQLAVAASGGDLIIYTNGAIPLTAGQLIDIDFGTPNREVRTIGTLTDLALQTPTSTDWPVGSLVTPMGPATTVMNPMPASGAGTISLMGRAGIYPGSVLSIMIAGVPTPFTVITVVTPRAAGADPGNVTISPALPSVPTSANLALTSSVTTTLSAAATAGSQVLALTSRVGLNAGSVLQLGVSPTQEYAVIVAVSGTRTVGPDPGQVVLAAPLVNSYPAALVPVIAYVLIPTLAAASDRASELVVDAPAGSEELLVSWPNWAGLPGVVQVTLPDGTSEYNVVTSTAAESALVVVSLSTPLQHTHPEGSPVIERSPLIQVQALDAGAWGQRIATSIQDETPGLVSSTRIVALVGPTQLQLSSLTGIEPGTYLEMLLPNGTLVDPSTPLKVSAVNRTTTTITLDNPVSGPQSSAIGTATPSAPITLRSREFQLTASLYQHPDPAVPSRNSQIIQSEVFQNLSMDPRHSHYFQTIIGAINGPLRLSDHRPQGTSWLIRTQDTAASAAAAQAPRLGPEVLVDVLPNGLQKPAQLKLDQGGDDSIATVDDSMYIGADDPDPVDRTGIYALQNVEQISIVAIPGQGTPAIQSALIDHCENELYRFAVLDPQYPDSAMADIQAQRQEFDTKFAAIYYPWLTIPDPFPPNLNNIAPFPLPPSGHVVGVYSRVDNSRGVFKAPANEVVQGITGLTATLMKGDQDVLNPPPTNINVIRDFRADDRGIRVWGAHVMTSDDNYKYVPVKRLLMFIEQSIDLGLQDVVFEPSTPSLWKTIERLISNFLTTVWNEGGLQGATPDQAFFVRCDMTTMTQDDIDAGRLIALVGVAPVMPAEFVIIQISLTVPTTSS
ncbi:MAG TPA: phage tail sheath subtilisin-like domain-containing protein [Steroidobacteraceae bacterium]|nr:phage tail sheath subtilisin-like domain-containing protein [Steroidobacteraceae bacterium]